MTELMTTDSAARIAEGVDFPELVEMLEVAKASNVDFVNIVPNETQDDVIVSPATGVMVAWMLPEDDAWDLSLAVEGGTTDHHITLAYLGEAADLDQDAQRLLIAVTAEVCQRHVGVKGTIQGTGSFDNETETVWYADVHIDQLAELQADLATSLIQAGLPVATDFDFTPHMTLAYLPAGSGEPTFDVAEFDAVISSLTVAIGGSRFDLPLQDIDWEDEEPPVEGVEYAPPIRTPFIPRISKALGDVDNDTAEEWRYTLGPVYMPGMVDAHGDSINADDLEHAIHDYVRSGNRDIHLQHEPDVIAGEWVGLLVWPWPVTVPVMDEGRLIQRTFPAGTPFMGVVWIPEVWELVKAGEIRGYSLGGMAQFVTVDFGDDADVAKFNPNHDAKGRFGQGAGGAGITPGEVQSADTVAAAIHDSAASAEPGVTKVMQQLAESNNATLEGLEFKLKTKDSLARKIAANAVAEGIPEAQAGANISDALRYTMQTTTASYTKTTTAVVTQLQSAGYKVRTKNYWKKGDPYQGVNVALTSQSGQRFELQFHTPQSMAVKNEIHLDYERFRTSNDPSLRRTLWDDMVGKANSIPVPTGVLAIPELRMQTLD